MSTTQYTCSGHAADPATTAPTRSPVARLYGADFSDGRSAARRDCPQPRHSHAPHCAYRHEQSRSTARGCSR